MKHKMLAVILALTGMSWAQTSTQTAPSQNPVPTDKAQPSCCEKMANGSKDGSPACMRPKDGKEMASCCTGKDEAPCCGKDAKVCMKDGKYTTDCCKEGSAMGKAASCCDRKECGKGCCGSNKSGKPA